MGLAENSDSCNSSTEDLALKYEEIMKTKPYQSLHVGCLTPELIARAEEELNETNDVRPKAISEMRSLILEETNLQCYTDDSWLLKFLRARKFNVKKAYLLHKKYFETKRDYPEVFGIRDTDMIEDNFKKGLAYYLPYRNEDGCPILVLKYSSWDPECNDVSVLLISLTALLLTAVEDPATQVTGIHILLDVKSIGLKHLRCFTPRYLNLVGKALRNTLPIRFKGIHIYNESTVFQYLFSILKIFLSDKIKNRIHFHGTNQKHLHKFLPKAILTEEYGGDNHTFNPKEWYKTEVEDLMPKFREMLRQGYQE